MAKILIVDDQACIRKLFSQELTHEGYTVASAGNVESVRRHLKSSLPDLVLLDLYLDGPEGWDVLKEIKTQYPHLPVLIVTAYDTYRTDTRLSQAEGYVVKSTDLRELKQEVGNVINRRLKQPTRAEPRPSSGKFGLAHGAA